LLNESDLLYQKSLQDKLATMGKNKQLWQLRKKLKYLDLH